VGRERAHQNGVAIRLRLRNRFGADVAAGARTIVDDELLTHVFRQPLRKDAADDVGSTPRRERDDHPKRLGRVDLGERRARSVAS